MQVDGALTCVIYNGGLCGIVALHTDGVVFEYQIERLAYGNSNGWSPTLVRSLPDQSQPYQVEEDVWHISTEMQSVIDAFGGLSDA